MPFRRRHPVRVAALIVLAIWSPFLAVRCVTADAGHTNCWLHHSSETHAASPAHAHGHGHGDESDHDGVASRPHAQRQHGSHNTDHNDPAETCCERSGKADLQLPAPPASLDAVLVVRSLNTVDLVASTAGTRWRQTRVEPIAHAPPLYLSLRSILV